MDIVINALITILGSNIRYWVLNLVSTLCGPSYCLPRQLVMSGSPLFLTFPSYGDSNVVTCQDSGFMIMQNFEAHWGIPDMYMLTNLACCHDLIASALAKAKTTARLKLQCKNLTNKTYSFLIPLSNAKAARNPGCQFCSNAGPLAVHFIIIALSFGMLMKTCAELNVQNQGYFLTTGGFSKPFPQLFYVLHTCAKNTCARSRPRGGRHLVEDTMRRKGVWWPDVRLSFVNELDLSRRGPRLLSSPGIEVLELV